MKRGIVYKLTAIVGGLLGLAGCASELVFPSASGETGGAPSPSATVPAPPLPCEQTGCSVSGQACSTTRHVCVECVADANCASAEFPHCDVAAGRCVACTRAADCGAGKVCVPGTGTCAKACKEDVDCGAAEISCDQVRGLCVQCQGNDRCDDQPALRHCDLGGRCAPCAANTDCPATTPYCDIFRSRCVACLEPEACPQGTACDVALGTCR